MIRFECECGKQLQAREENAGQKVLCPACGGQPVVPAAAADAIRTADEGVRPASARRPARPEDDDDFEAVPSAAGPTATSRKASLSLVLGLMSVFCNMLTAGPAVILGILALGDIGRSRGRLSGRGLAVAGIIAACTGTLLSFVGIILIGLLLPAVQKVREAAANVQSANNLKQMGIALHNYHNQKLLFPAAAVCDKNGKPLLSWRVALLPFLDQQGLYAQFKLDEPWDGPNNIKLLPLMPKVYQCPLVPAPSGETVYRVFVGNGAAFEMTRGLQMPRDFPDGTSFTLLVVEANQSVPWTKPDELPYDPNKPLPALGGHSPRGFQALAVDGSVHTLPQNTPEATVRQLITRNDGMPAFFP